MVGDLNAGARAGAPAASVVLPVLACMHSFRQAGKTVHLNCRCAWHACAGVESQAYQILSSTLRDSSCTEGCCPAPGLLPAGNSTFCGFDDSISSVIDFIFVNDAVQVHSFGVVNAKTPSGACVSDHKPIVAEIELA